jgi:hypothetical protein
VQATNGNGYSLWPTAVANDDNKSVEAHLAMKKRMGERDGTNSNRTAITSLNVKAKEVSRKLWATASTRDYKDGACLNANVPVNKLLGRESVQVSSRLAQTEIGPKSQNTSGLRLNPVFVRWLMGWGL